MLSKRGEKRILTIDLLTWRKASTVFFTENKTIYSRTWITIWTITIRKESRDCMKHFIIDYEILKNNIHLSGCQQTTMLLLFIIFFRPGTFFIRNSIMTINTINSIILSIIALLPYYYISKKCNCIFTIFITIFLYSVLYSFIISAIVSPLAILTENKIFHYIHIIADPFRINVFLTYGFLIYLMKHPQRL